MISAAQGLVLGLTLLECPLLNVKKGTLLLQRPKETILGHSLFTSHIQEKSCQFPLECLLDICVLCAPPIPYLLQLTSLSLYLGHCVVNVSLSNQEGWCPKRKACFSQRQHCFKVPGSAFTPKPTTCFPFLELYSLSFWESLALCHFLPGKTSTSTWHLQSKHGKWGGTIGHQKSPYSNSPESYVIREGLGIN